MKISTSIATIWKQRAPLFLLGLTGLLISCGPGDRAKITESRFVNPDAIPPSIDATTSQRFSMMMPVEPKPEQSAPKNPFRWETPEGWTEKTPTRMRPINFSFGPNQIGECYLTALPGSAGGLSANINRWRGQMGLPAQTDEEINTLPSVPFLDGTAPLLKLDGTFTGMGGKPQDQYRMLGTIVASQDLTLFVKMVGPRDLLADQEENFKKFVSTLRISAR